MGVLDDMTKGITDRKSKAAGATLTPVGTEASPIKPSLVPGREGGEAAFPSDLPTQFMSHEAMGTQAAELRTMAGRADKLAEELRYIATGIEALIGEPAAVASVQAERKAVAEKLAQKEADRQAADRDKAAAGDKAAAKRVTEAEEFAARYAAQQAEAQAAVFTSSDDEPKGPAAPTPSSTEGWVCPDHGDEDIEQLSSRLRPAGYMACAVAGCGEFEPK